MYRDLIFNIFTVAIFSVYIIGSLWLSDNLLSAYLPGYVFSGNYKIGICIFFLVALSYIYWAQWRQWGNWRFYIFGSIAVFFPLVFISSSVNVLVNPASAMISSFSTLYCQPGSLDKICGKAFAAVVSSMSLRALPAVLTAPALMYFFALNKNIK